MTDSNDETKIIKVLFKKKNTDSLFIIVYLQRTLNEVCFCGQLLSRY